MSENAEALAVILEEAGEAAYARICARLCGDRVWFPHRRHGVPISVSIQGYLRAGYDVKRIAHHLGCSVQYVRVIKRSKARRCQNAIEKKALLPS